jgi:hypothetical protein
MDLDQIYQAVSQRLEALVAEQRSEINNLRTQLDALASVRATEVTQNIQQPAKIKVPDKWSGPGDRICIQSWSYSMRNYLKYYNLGGINGVPVVISLLTGTAALWLQTNTLINNTSTAEELVNRLVEWADPPYNIRKYRDDLAQLKQRNQSVVHYIDQFRSICLKIPDISTGEMFERFLEGIRPEIRVAILQQTLNDLNTAYRVAQAYEGVRVGAYYRPSQHLQNNPEPGAPMEVDQVEPGRRLLRLTEEQRQQLIQNNGCFACRRVQAGHIARNCPHRVRRNVDRLSRDRPVPVQVNVANVEEVGSLATERFERVNEVIPRNSLYDPVQGKPLSSIKPSPKRTFTPDYDYENWQLNPVTANNVFEKWGKPKIDLFASIWNKQAELYIRELLIEGLVKDVLEKMPLVSPGTSEI